MTTAAPSTVPKRVGLLVSKIVKSFQRSYLNDESHAVAALARLRRGAGKEALCVPDLWNLVDTRPLHERPQDGGRPLREDELIRAEDSVHVALTLWALHQQSRGTGMHRSDSRKSPAGLGAAVRELMPPGDIAEPVLKRLVRAGNAPDLPALAPRLRDIVLLLRREDIALDYALLAEQLYQWQEAGGRDAVRRAWGRSFHAYRPDGTDTGDGPSAAASDQPVLSADTTDKDAL
ncbi:type I-E CRISPR-associated protein Cse2/CasB [Streptomyces sp. NPDC001840]